MSRCGRGFRQIQELIGYDNAIKLCRGAGGIDRYIPKRAKPDHKFARLIGMEAWESFCAIYGGERLTLPTLNEFKTKRRRILALLREGRLSVSKIAEEAGSTERYASMISGQLKKQPLPLFDEPQNNKPRAAQRPPAPRGVDIRSQQRGTAAMK